MVVSSHLLNSQITVQIMVLAGTSPPASPKENGWWSAEPTISPSLALSQGGDAALFWRRSPWPYFS